MPSSHLILCRPFFFLPPISPSMRVFSNESTLHMRWPKYWSFSWRVMVERSDRMWSTGEGNGKPLQYSCLENPMNSMKRQNDSILKEELPRSIGVQYATGDKWRNNSRKHEGMEPKQKQHPAVNGTGDRSNVQWEPGMSGPWIKANWKWSDRRWRERRPSRNQWTKMDWNGWV